MSKALHITGLILGGVCLGIVIAGVALYLFVAKVKRDVARAFAPSDVSAVQTADAGRIHFLQAVDFDKGPVTLILEESVTGAGSLVIDNQAELRAHQAHASIPDLGVGGDMRLIPMLINGRKLSQRVMATRIYQNGIYLGHEYCLPDLCANDPETRDSLAPLMRAASGRVVQHVESYTDYAAYLVAYAYALDAPGRFTPLHPVPDGEATWPLTVTLYLPPFEIASPFPFSDATFAEIRTYKRAIEQAIQDRLGGGNIMAEIVPLPSELHLRTGCQPAPLPQNRTIMQSEIRIRTDLAGRDRAEAITDWSFLPPPPVPDDLPRITPQAQTWADCLLDHKGDPLFRPTGLGPVTEDEYRITWEESVPLEPADESALLE